ncbi:MAG: glycosyltransferase family 39 protein [Nanoarchaeota archaeon]|nr:glycosyltransferase family 39 protein [Nanoarchaeota archaeon]
MRKDLRDKVIIAWVLAIILLGAGILRLYDLGEESLWLDECFTLDYASKPVNLLIETLKKDVHPIGYYLPQHLLMEYFGYSEISLRILSVFFGVLTVFLTFLLARKIFSWKEGLLAAFLVSISYTSVLYSQEAKMYSMFAAFFLLSLLSFIAFMKKPSVLNTLFFSVSVALLLYTHIISLAILAGYIVFYSTGYFFKQKKKDTVSPFFQRQIFSPKFFLALLMVFLLFLPWLNILAFYQLPLLYKSLGGKLIEKLGFDLLPLAVVVAAFLGLFYFITLYLVMADKINLNILIGHLKRIFTYFSNQKIISLLLLSFIMMDLIWSRYFFSSVHIIRFGFFLLPLGYILLSRILLRIKQNSLATGFFILIVISASAELYTYYDIDSKEQFHEAAEYIESHATSADVLFLHRATIAKLCFDYYYSGNVEEVRLITPGEDDYLLIERASEKRDAYLILSHNFHTKDYFKLRLDSLYELKEERKFIGVTIYKYEVLES